MRILRRVEVDASRWLRVRALRGDHRDEEVLEGDEAQDLRSP